MAAFGLDCRFQASNIALHKPAKASFFGNCNLEMNLWLVSVMSSDPENTFKNILMNKTYVYNFITMIQFR